MKGFTKPTNPKKLAKYEKVIQEYKELMQQAEENGIKVYKSLKAGSNSIYTYDVNGEKSAYGFDTEGQAAIHALKNIDNSKTN